MTVKESGIQRGNVEKVVIRSSTALVKGYMDDPSWNEFEQLLREPPEKPPSAFPIRHRESGIVEHVPSEDMIALIYVKTFEGNPEHRDINFHSHVPTVDGIWVRLELCNGEIMEGLVYNSLRHLVDPGFFLLPTDPESNNKLVYVMKKSLVDYRVLGIRRLESPEELAARLRTN